MHYPHPVFIYTLLFQANTPILSRQLIIQTTNTSWKNDFTEKGKFTKTLPDLPIFIVGKNLSIDQWLSKMQNKFKINWDYYPTDRNKLIYAENRIRRETLQLLKTCL